MFARFVFAAFVAACPGAAAWAQQEVGLVARWDFDEGKGEVAHDGSGHDNDGQLHGPRWVQRGQGHALAFDGVDDYVDCGAGPSLDLTEAVSIEAWVNPETIPEGEPMIVGKFFESYGLTMYKDGGCWWYISSGGNNLKAPAELGKWNHIVGTFDGATMTLWINRRRVGSKQSKSKSINQGKSLLMGALTADPAGDDPAHSRKAHWRGMLDEVRIYSRALSDEEILSHYKQAAAGYGVNVTWFDRLRIIACHFRPEQRMLLVCDYSGVFPRPADASLEAILVREGETEALQRQEFRPLPTADQVAAEFALGDLPPGQYCIRGVLTAPDGLRVTAEHPFSHPASDLEVPSPAEQTVPPLPSLPAPVNYGLEVHPGGGFTVEARGQRFPFESSYSYPNGGENRLLAGERDEQGEPSWRVETRRLAEDSYEVVGRGQHYSITRRIRLYPNRINVQDTIRNETDDDLGIILDNHLDAREQPFAASAVAGYPSGVKRRASGSPSSFVAWEGLGIGMLPLDDVYIIQSTVYAREGVAGVSSDQFGLAPKASYTLEWAVYPLATADYYDFINAVRRDEGRTATIEGGFAFIPREGVSAEHVELRGLRYGSFGCLSHVADDPEIEIEGIEFIRLPKERARLKAEFEAIRAVNPSLKLMFHVAHSLWSTNRPSELFPDSRVVDAGGNHVIYPYDYDACAYFSRQRHKAGWRWYIYYPTPGNSFHDALMHSVDVMMDDIGCDGAFMDGFMWGYGSPLTYDRWDGHTVRINPETKTIKRKVGSVLLLSQPSMVEFARKMHAEGGVVVANNVIMTRTIGELPLIVDQECRSGPDVHLARTPAALGNPRAINCEADVYRDVLDKLKWGNLYFYYGEGKLTYASLPQQMYPITVEEIRSGTIKGQQRLITSRSGVYGWRGSRELHFGYRYNCLGMQVPAEFLTTVDAAGARTSVQLGPDESAVIKKVPLYLQSAHPVNLICERYDRGAIAISFNGQGEVELQVKDGEFSVNTGARYRVAGARAGTIAADAGGGLKVHVELRGPNRLTIEPAEVP